MQRESEAVRLLFTGTKPKTRPDRFGRRCALGLLVKQSILSFSSHPIKFPATLSTHFSPKASLHRAPTKRTLETTNCWSRFCFKNQNRFHSFPTPTTRFRSLTTKLRLFITFASLNTAAKRSVLVYCSIRSVLLHQRINQNPSHFPPHFCEIFYLYLIFVI